MRFATALSSAALASVALAMPTNEWHGESYGGNGKKHEHEVSPTAPEYTNTTAPVDVSPTQPTPYSTPVDVSPTTPTPSKPVIGDYPHKEVSPTTPGQYNGGNDCARNCITDQQADQGAEIFRQLIQNYTETLALSALTPDFEDYTSSVNIIRNRGNKGPIQVNGISFTSREDFMNAQGSQPQIPFDTLNVWHGCDTITVRWQTTDSAAGQPTKANNIPAPGLAVLSTIPATDNQYGFRIKTLYSEFNAAAWLVNLGVFTPTPGETSKRDLPHIAAI